MRLTEADTNDAARWIAGRLNSMLENLPEDDPCRMNTSILEPARQRWRRHRGFGEGGRPRGMEATAGKTPAFTDHIRARFETVR